MTSTATRLLRLAALVQLSPDPAASWSLFSYGDEFEVAFQAEDLEDDLSFVRAAGLDEVLDLGTARARLITPDLDPAAARDVVAPADLDASVERALAGLLSGGPFGLGYVPRSPVLHGEAWELVVGPPGGEVVHLDPTLAGVLRDWVRGH